MGSDGRFLIPLTEDMKWDEPILTNEGYLRAHLWCRREVERLRAKGDRAVMEVWKGGCRVSRLIGRGPSGLPVPAAKEEAVA